MAVTKKITLEVSRRAAEAFDAASDEERRALSRVIEHHLVQRRDSLREFREIADRIGNYAQRQGLTKEQLDALLADES